MAKFAILDGENIINIIIADSKEIAENISNKICVEFTIEPAELGGLYKNNVFIPKKPYDSWILNNKNYWIPPIEQPIKPDTNFIWDETNLSWVEV